MHHIAAYLLCVLGGKESPSSDDVSAVITSCGGEVNEDQLNLFFSEIEGKDLAELFAAGKASMEQCSNAAGM